MRVAICPVAPPGGAVPSVPLSVHTSGFCGNGIVCGFKNGTSERLVPAFPCSKPGPLGLAAFCLAALRDASANGIAQTARSRSRINALQSRCALIECLICFFIVLALVIFED